MKCLFIVSLLLSFVGESWLLLQEAGICPLITANAQSLNSATSTLIYQCRPGDNCGGVGDRLAGIMAGAYFAMSIGRAFRIDWKGLSDVFEPGTIDWTYKPSDLGIESTHDATQLVSKDTVNEVMGFGRISALSPKYPYIAVLNDMNGRQINNASMLAKIAPYKHLFFHSNRGPDLISYRNLSQALHLPVMPHHDVRLLHYEAYRCIFNAILQPKEAFLNSTYKPISQPAMEFRKVIELAQNPKYPSLAYHYRVPDMYVAKDDPKGIIDNRKLLWIAKHGQQNRHKPNMNLFFITNSPASAARVLELRELRKRYKAIYIQELTGTTHINMVPSTSDNSTDISSNKPHSQHMKPGTVKQTFLQAMQDWYILRSAQMLMCGQSGFCQSAGLVGSANQLKYDFIAESFRIMPHICTNRECV